MKRGTVARNIWLIILEANKVKLPESKDDIMNEYCKGINLTKELIWATKIS